LQVIVILEPYIANRKFGLAVSIYGYVSSAAEVVDVIAYAG
jgi:hypothetical protein